GRRLGGKGTAQRASGTARTVPVRPVRARRVAPHQPLTLSVELNTAPPTSSYAERDRPMTSQQPESGRGGGLLERLATGPVICAEGYLFELERRGYLQAGAFVPEVVLDHPERVTALHEEFVHAGSDVVEAFTYYAHREKMR